MVFLITVVPLFVADHFTVVPLFVADRFTVVPLFVADHFRVSCLLREGRRKAPQAVPVAGKAAPLCERRQPLPAHQGG